MPTKSWYELQLLGVPDRYELTRTAQSALKLLDRKNMGAHEVAEIGRKIRLSRNMRKAISGTIRKCATMLVNNPAELKICTQLIEMCTELFDIADGDPLVQGFPFMKLPREIRDRVMSLMIDQVFPSHTIVPQRKKSSCSCMYMTRPYTYQSTMMKMLPSTLGRAMKDEFFVPFYRKKLFHFKCCCDLYAQLVASPQLFEHVRTVKVDWCGIEADKAFLKLSMCPNLQSLKLVVSKATLVHLTPRETTMKAFFPMAYRVPRLTDSLGIDQLLRIRGLTDVTAEHGSPGQRCNLSDLDVGHLRELLNEFLRREKGDYYDDKISI